MCWICLDFRDGIISGYDATLVSYDLPDLKHAEELRNLIKSVSEKLTKPPEDRPTEDDEQPEPFAGTYGCFTSVPFDLKGKALTKEMLAEAFALIRDHSPYRW